MLERRLVAECGQGLSTECVRRESTRSSLQQVDEHLAVGLN